MAFSDRLQHAWNAFLNKDPTPEYNPYGVISSYNPFRMRPTRGNERSIVVSVYNRIALDVAAIDIMHAKLDDNGRFIEEMDTGLNDCLALSANIDQTAKAFMQDVVMSMMDEGCVAIVPVDTTINPNISGSYDINSLRTGQILEWRKYWSGVHNMLKLEYITTRLDRKKIYYYQKVLSLS